MRQVGEIEILSHVISIGAVEIDSDYELPTPADQQRIDLDDVRCAFPQSSKRMVEEINDAHTQGDTLGGIVEVLAYGTPPGLGSH
ncbi:MAG: chorismate synthase, partial [Betaproteobacteria bacterium]|nr:chorismate synthase [Betaproteobacteria bacterium]